MNKRSPKWARDELILALDLYFRLGAPDRWVTADDEEELIKLSQTLNQLPIHKNITNPTFRNRNGVYMKLSNFLSLDPNYSGEGLRRGGKLDKEVWDAFSEDPDKLSRLAQSIKDSQGELTTEEVEAATTDWDEVFEEGKIITTLHKRRERDQRAVRRKKEKVIKETGSLKCEVCDFDFFERYGELGKGFAECHHIEPLHEAQRSRQVRLADLAIVCANCHRMLHRSKPMKKLGELRSLLRPG